MSLTMTYTEFESLHGGIAQIDEAIRGQFTVLSAEVLVETAEGTRFQLSNPDGRSWTITHIPEERSDADTG